MILSFVLTLVFALQLDNDSFSSEEGADSGDEATKKPEKKGLYVPPKLAAVPYGKLSGSLRAGF